MQNDLKLGSQGRKFFKEPLGHLYRDSKESAVEKIIKQFKSASFPLLITVGDIVTEYFWNSDLFPALGIVDGRTQRDGQVNFSILLSKEVEVVTMSNPPGIIRAQVWELIRKRINIYVSQKIVSLVRIDGEEDLLVIPAVLVAPMGTIVVYGQPNAGIVVIEVCKKSKMQFRSYLAFFNKILRDKK